MSLLELLATGRLGVTLRLPKAWAVAGDDGATAELVDPEHGVSWWLFAAEGLHLDLGEADLEGLGEAARDHARFMFEDVHARDEAGGGPPRTSDPDWSPMVDFERSVLQGSPVLRSVHRMSYRPGREIMLGHLLVPRPWGLFEARVAAADQVTGMRESVHMLSLRRQQGADAFGPGKAIGTEGDEPKGLPSKVSQAIFDDPALDASFPQHCLSRTRAALRWLTSEAELRLDAVALPTAAKETTIAGLGCTVRPPPRFFAMPDEAAMFWRASFCATDGIERFFVQRSDGRIERGGLAAHAEKAMREVHEASGVTGIGIHVEEHQARPGRTDVLVIVEGMGHQGRLRNAGWWLLDEASRPWSLSITSTAAISRERITAELLAAGRSWRLLR